MAELSERKLPRGFLPVGLARTLLKTPGLERIARGPLGAQGAFDRLTFYNCRGTLALLEDTGVRCPTFDTYAERLVTFVRGVHAASRQKLEDEVFDPFD